MAAEIFAIEVVYAASPENYRLITLTVTAGTTLGQAIQQSGIVRLFPEITPDNKVGIWGEHKTYNTVISAGDRLEIYRPIQVDPMAVRHEKAKKYRVKRLRVSDRE